ncbi:hypothetical protein BD769DRAFT_1406671 [Suillus cothurnatus]|nr:hypothetical protein BD769DRAFT_1406671 [Suillus cothurnatus]
MTADMRKVHTSTFYSSLSVAAMSLASGLNGTKAKKLTAPIMKLVASTVQSGCQQDYGYRGKCICNGDMSCTGRRETLRSISLKRRLSDSTQKRSMVAPAAARKANLAKSKTHDERVSNRNTTCISHRWKR